MGSVITEERRKELEAMLQEAEPYTPDDPEYDQFDGQVDLLRMRSTAIKELLSITS